MDPVLPAISPVVSAALVAAAVSLASVLFGRQLTERSALRDRIWDRKAAAYAETLEALEMLRRRFARPLGTLPSGAEQSDLAEDRAAVEQMYRLVAGQSWLLPAAARERIGGLDAAFQREYGSYREYFDAAKSETYRAITDFRDIAEADMARQPLWKFSQ